jgi:hypothetical protein
VVTLDLLAMTANLEHLEPTGNRGHLVPMPRKLTPSCQLRNNVLVLHLLDREDRKVHLDLQDLVGNLEDQDLTVKLEHLGHLDLLVQTEAMAHLDPKDHLDLMANKHLVSLDLRDHPDLQDHPVHLALPENRDPMANLVDPEHQELQATKEALESLENLAKMADPVVPETLEHLVPVLNVRQLVWPQAINENSTAVNFLQLAFLIILISCLSLTPLLHHQQNK